MRKIDRVIHCCEVCPYIQIGRIESALHRTGFCYCSAKGDPLQFSGSAQQTVARTLEALIPDVASIPDWCPLPTLDKEPEVEQ